ncbi:MAG: M55 family metallopeptidase [Chloroflexi bacterium]|nr:M55 family metallopeptidase [Chloroflexota bacterium]
MTIKSVYMFTDLEGAAGIDDWDPRHRDDGAQARGVADRAEMQRLLTGEVNAAAQGCFDAGAEEVLICDAHGAGRTILVEELISGVTIARGTNRPMWLLGIAPRFGALVQVSMHAMAGTPVGCLAHTQSQGFIYRLNGREVGEMEQAAYLAGDLGIPWVFTSGDVHACREAASWVPGLVTAPVKTGLGLNCAIHLAPVDARKLIRERIQEALRKAGEIKPLVLPSPCVLEVQKVEPWPAQIKAGAERVDAFTLRYTGASAWQVLHHHFYGKPDLPLPE